MATGRKRRTLEKAERVVDAAKQDIVECEPSARSGEALHGNRPLQLRSKQY
jgi:hypothetical protein